VSSDSRGLQDVGTVRPTGCQYFYYDSITFLRRADEGHDDRTGDDDRVNFIFHADLF